MWSEDGEKERELWKKRTTREQAATAKHSAGRGGLEGSAGRRTAWEGA